MKKFVTGDRLSASVIRINKTINIRMSAGEPLCASFG